MLTTEIFVGDPGRIRTCDHPLRRRMLYPTELRERKIYNYLIHLYSIVNCFFQAFISFHLMMASVLVGRETNRRQFLEEHSINRPLPLVFEPQTQFTGFIFLQIVFIVSIAYRISSGKSTTFFNYSMNSLSLILVSSTLRPLITII